MRMEELYGVATGGKEEWKIGEERGWEETGEEGKSEEREEGGGDLMFLTT